MVPSSSLSRPPNTGPRPSQQFLPPPTHPSLRSTDFSPTASPTRPSVPPRPTPPHASTPRLDVPHSLAGSSGQRDDPYTSCTFEHEPNEPRVLPEAEEELCEVELRERYDNEEIDRFLYLFSAYVREATVKQSSTTASQQGAGISRTQPASDLEDLEMPGGNEDVELDEWAEPGESSELSTPPLPPRPDNDRCLSERIVIDYILPLLLPAEPPLPAFTVRRLYLTGERLYLATMPAYEQLARRLVCLALWQDKKTSLFYCAAYWFLWYHNFLLPALVLRILYSLVRRKLLPYPTLGELREHRRNVERAKEFSAAVTAQIVTAPTYDVQDAWRLIRNFHYSRKMKRTAKVKAKSEGVMADHTPDDGEATTEEPSLPEGPTEEELDIKRISLALLNYVADLHERVRNIFLWRRPISSSMYGVALFGAFLVTLLPTKYMAKLLGLGLGVVFWHIVPIMAAIPPSRRTRFPPLFKDVPTDAEYAMELISQRVARGMDIKPRSRSLTGSTVSQEVDRFSLRSESGEGSINSAHMNRLAGATKWQKLANRVDNSKSLAMDAKRLFRNGQWKRPENWLSLNPLAPKVAMPNGSSEPRLQTYTFPAQYAMASGLITLTPDAFFFTPLLSSTAKLAVPLTAICGVKKTGPMRGLNVRWERQREDGESEEREEKFVWVGDRNELFARLVAWGGRSWASI